MLQKENAKKVKLLLVLFSFFCLFSFSEKVSATTYNFDSYSTGALAGQDSWATVSGSAVMTVGTTRVLSSPNSVNGSNTADFVRTRKTIPSITTLGYVSAKFYYSDTAGTGASMYKLAVNENNTYTGGVGIRLLRNRTVNLDDPSTGTGCTGDSGNPTDVSLNLNAWNTLAINIERVGSNTQYDYYINGYHYTRTCTNHITFINVLIGSDNNMNAFYDKGYYDDIKTETVEYVSEYTQITSITPINGSTIATSSTNTIGATGILNETDLNAYSRLKIHLENSNTSFQQCADVICATFASSSISRDFYESLLFDGAFSYSSSTTGLPIGRYYVTTSIEKGSLCFVGFCFWTTTVVSTSSTFIVSTTTKIDKIKDNATTYLDSLTQDTSTFDNCTVTSFDFFECFSDLTIYLFVPNQSELNNLVDTLHTGVLVHFPLGYVTDFIDILSTTTVGTLTPINATLPSGVIGAGATINLDITNSFDTMLEATTGVFTNASASSTDTFFDITNSYWEIVLYVLAGLYIIRRILGSGVIPHKHI